MKKNKWDTMLTGANGRISSKRVLGMFILLVLNLFSNTPIPKSANAPIIIVSIASPSQVPSYPVNIQMTITMSKSLNNHFKKNEDVNILIFRRS